jgi:hypothetical protein
MTDPRSTPEPIDYAVFYQEQREHARRAEELLAANKAVLFDALAAAGIETVIITFDGYGDSGQIEHIDAGVGEKTIPLPPDPIEIARTTWGVPKSSARPRPFTRPSKRWSMISSARRIVAGRTTTERMVSSPSTSLNDRSSSTITSDTPRPKTSSTNFEEASMAHPYHHALSSVRKWGGAVEDYLAIHSWFDASKQITADFRHRALRHHAEGIFMLETIFGPTTTLSSGRVIPTRWVGEQHVLEDLGFIPSFADWVRGIPARTLDGACMANRT